MINNMNECQRKRLRKLMKINIKLSLTKRSLSDTSSVLLIISIILWCQCLKFVVDAEIREDVRELEDERERVHLRYYTGALDHVKTRHLRLNLPSLEQTYRSSRLRRSQPEERRRTESDAKNQKMDISRHRHRRQHDDRQEQRLIDDTGGTEDIQRASANRRNGNRSHHDNQGRNNRQNSGASVNGNAADRQVLEGGSPSSEPAGGQNNQRVIETAIFIDQALDNKFDGMSGGLADLNKLVLTIMNQVQQLFRYSSLKMPITIKLVLVEHLKDSERHSSPLPNPEKGDIDAYLSNFCNWQQARLEREKRLWWDHAILLSGLDLYKSTPTRNHTGVLGLAWVGGMCRENYSCTINEASNLESAFVIAHEIGHSLGIMHDGQRNTCDPNGFIMSERTGAGKVHWSRCSNSYLNESVNRNQLRCLETERSLMGDSLFDLSKLRAPGQVYSINDQCRLAFGHNYTSFVTRQQPFNAVCKELWCVSGSWAKAAHPALEGSSCGDQERVCREGKCVR